MMVLWILLLVIVFIICVYVVGQKIYDEQKIKRGQRDLAGKVRLKLKLKLFVSTQHSYTQIYCMIIAMLYIEMIKHNF